MLSAALTPIPGHSVFLLLIQLSLLLIVARSGAFLARTLGLPAVVGELGAGIVLGPTGFGHFFPKAFDVVFPYVSEQFQLLEVVGLLGMTLLLLLTGLETDLKLLKNLGRAAVVASVMGMAVPFAMGFGLGVWMPDEYLAKPDQRELFAAFLATAMAISAMPVIAKILMDLDLTKRNIGLVILSAGVVDDTAGWLILSVIAGAATHGGAINLGALGVTLAALGIFLLACAFVLYPLMRVGMKAAVNQRKVPETDLVLVVAVTFLAAAITENIGVHAVFGAFVVGTVLKQVPHLNQHTVHKLESFVFSILAPIFFGIVGLKVNLWSLQGGNMLGVVLTIACLGKLVGCTLGGLWGGMRFWEALAIAVAMNARGAMELVVASIGLSLGILNQQMFSIIVVVAIATSFMAPIGLRLIMRMVRLTDDEARRMAAVESRGLFDPKRVRVLLPTSGGPNAYGAANVAFQMAGSSENPPEVVYVQQRQGLMATIARKLRGLNQQDKDIDAHLEQLKQLGSKVNARAKRLVGSSVAQTVIDEAKSGFDMICVGASGEGMSLGGPVLEDMVVDAPCHVAIVKAGKEANGSHAPERAFKRLLVWHDGTTAARAAAEFALRVAEASGGELTLVMLGDQQPVVAPVAEPLQPDEMPVSSPSIPLKTAEQVAEEQLARVSTVFRASSLKPKMHFVPYDPEHRGVTDELQKGEYDLLVLGAENRAVSNRMFFGFGNQRVIASSPITTVIVVPKISITA